MSTKISKQYQTKRLSSILKWIKTRLFACRWCFPETRQIDFVCKSASGSRGMSTEIVVKESIDMTNARIFF